MSLTLCSGHETMPAVTIRLIPALLRRERDEETDSTSRVGARGFDALAIAWGSVGVSAPVEQTPVQSSASNVEERIARIEHGLLPPVLVKGEPPPGMSLVDRMSFYKVAGVSIAVIDQGRIAWARGYGFADIAAKRPVTAETRFQAASISKPVAAAAALHFVEERRIDLDRNVNDDLKSWKVPENDLTREQKVTLRRILSHSAGLTVHGFPGYEAGKPVPTLVAGAEWRKAR